MADLPIAEVEVDGWDNRTFRLGSELTVRLPSGDWYAKQVEKEQRWLPVLAPQLPLPIPTPVAKGAPDAGYPYPWSVYRWLRRRARLEGAASTTWPPSRARSPGSSTPWAAPTRPTGPRPGEHNFFRGGPLATYEEEALEALDTLGDEVPATRSCARGTTP